MTRGGRPLAADYAVGLRKCGEAGLNRLDLDGSSHNTFKNVERE
jgi:hypothetical protein